MEYYCIWSRTENVEESFWKCADMTGQTVAIEKVDNRLPHTSNIMWFRFVPMEEAEVAAYQNRERCRSMLAHWDGDFHGCDNAQTPQDYCMAIDAVKDSDVGVICQEVMNDQIDYSHPNPDYRCRQPLGIYRAAYFRALSENREAVYAAQIAYAHKCGMKMFASHRMQLSNFGFPINQPFFEVPFISAHPQLRCQARDGRFCEFLSYGYREVQDYVIGLMLESAAQGFDGVEHIWIRGQHLLFEEPVQTRFREKYGDVVDCRRLPPDDPRLMETRADIMVEFYVRLRQALYAYAAQHGTEPMKIYAAVYFDLESSKQDSLDVERLASQGLIDGIVQCKMSVWEETDDVRGEDGLIDVEKYAKKAESRFIYNRRFGNDMDIICQGIPAYRAVADRYGVDFYTEVQWESSCPVQEFVKAAKQIYAAGGSRIALWDTQPSRTVHLAEWDATSRLGNPDAVCRMSKEDTAYHTVYKVLSWGGRDMRYINPSWRG